MSSNARTQSHSAPTRFDALGNLRSTMTSYERPAPGPYSDPAERPTDGLIEGVEDIDDRDSASVTQPKGYLVATRTNPEHPLLKRNEPPYAALSPSPGPSKRLRTETTSTPGETTPTTAELINRQQFASTDVLSRLVDLEAQNAQLRERNEQLKGEIDELKAEKQKWTVDRSVVDENAKKQNTLIGGLMKRLRSAEEEAENAKRWEAHRKASMDRTKEHLLKACDVLGLRVGDELAWPAEWEEEGIWPLELEEEWAKVRRKDQHEERHLDGLIDNWYKLKYPDDYEPGEPWWLSG